MEADSPLGSPAEGAEGYDRARYNPAMRKIWPWPALLLEEVARWINRLPGQTWLDAACGEGQLCQLVRGNKQVVGLDLDPRRLARARSRPYWALMQGAVTSIPLRDATLQGIASVETLEHVPDLDGALREFARCLRPQGHLVITVPSVTLRSLRQMRQARRPVYCDEKEHVRELSSIAITGFSHKFETWHGFETRLQRHGFTIVKTGGVGFVLPVWDNQPAWITHAMNLLSRESVNRWLGKLPFLRRFPYYRLYVLCYRGGALR